MEIAYDFVGTRWEEVRVDFEPDLEGQLEKREWGTWGGGRDCLVYSDRYLYIR